MAISTSETDSADIGKWKVRLGNVSLEPCEPVTAGALVQWRLTYTAGTYGVDEGGIIVLAKRTACDMEIPQFQDPLGSGYTTVSTHADCRLSAYFQRKRAPRPWQKWCLVIDVEDGFIRPGECVTVTLGDRSKGSSGIRAQSFVETAHEFRVWVDPTNAAAPRLVPDCPKIPIEAGSPVRLACTVPSVLAVGERGPVFVKGEDAWNNPTPPPGDVILETTGGDGLVLADGHVLAQSHGLFRVRASCSGLTCMSNPLQIVADAPALRHYWGDLHGQTGNTVGTGSDEEYFTFARDWARLDFVGHQGNDFQVSEQDWKRLKNVIQKMHQDGRYVIFPGYEWSGNTSAGGDHNVLFLADDPPIFRSSHWQVPQVPETDDSPANPVTELFERLKKLGGALAIPHVGGRYADVRRFFDPQLTPVVEILSCHGVFEWMLWDALEGGHTVGVVCNSDGHKGRPGAEGPGAGQFGVAGGMTCIKSPSLDRKSLFEALRSRHCYGTSGPRILLDFTADGHEMGDAFQAGPCVTFRAHVAGLAPIEALSLLQGPHPIHTERPAEFGHIEESRRLRIWWQGARIRGRARKAKWDGTVHIEGNRIERVDAIAFDSPADGIVQADADRVIYRSTTAGDRDGLDVMLGQARVGTVTLECPMGKISCDLKTLDGAPKIFDFGGLGLEVRVERYPETLTRTELTLKADIEPPRDSVTPYLVKAVQTDGHMAWSSPIFINTQKMERRRK